MRCPLLRGYRTGMRSHSKYATDSIPEPRLPPLPRLRFVAHLTDIDQDITTLPRPDLRADIKERLLRPSKQNGAYSKILSQTTENPSVKRGQYQSGPISNGSGYGGNARRSSRRYFASADDGNDWPPELSDYNKRFSKTLECIKRRHDSVVTTVGKRDYPWTYHTND